GLLVRGGGGEEECVCFWRNPACTVSSIGEEFPHRAFGGRNLAKRVRAVQITVQAGRAAFAGFNRDIYPQRMETSAARVQLLKMDFIPGRRYIGHAACPICERSECFDGKRLPPILGATLRQRLVQSEVKHIHTRLRQGNLVVTLVRVQRRFWRQPVFQPVCSSNRTTIATEPAGSVEQQVMEFPITERPSI